MSARSMVSSPWIGYLLRTFPVLSETFVAGEIRSVASLTGHPPVVAALNRPGQGQGGGWSANCRDRLLYWRDIDKSRLGEVALAHARFLSTTPGRALSGLLRTGDGRPALKDRVKAPVLADFFLRHGVTHLHSHFAWEQAELLAHVHGLTGLPYSLTLHAADIFVSPGRLASRLSGAAFVATISEFNRDLLINSLGLSEKKVHVVRCGVDLKAFPFSPARRTRPARLVSIGRMVPKKGFDVLLLALAMLRAQGMDFEVELVGDGPLRPELERLAGGLDLGDAVRFTGALEPGQTAERLKRAQIFVLACRRAPDGDMDGIPVALMEAMALGRCVVSTRLSGIPELVAEGCGLLAEPGDPDSLAAALRQALSDPDMAQDMLLTARRRVERDFTLDVQAGRIVELAAGRGGQACVS